MGERQRLSVWALKALAAARRRGSNLVQKVRSRVRGDDDGLPLPRAKSRTARTDLPGENLCPTPRLLALENILFLFI